VQVISRTGFFRNSKCLPTANRTGMAQQHLAFCGHKKVQADRKANVIINDLATFFVFFQPKYLFYMFATFLRSSAW
jgi:hypothetical protein